MITFNDEWTQAEPDDLVSFAVVCGPVSKINYNRCGELLREGQLAECMPDAQTVKRVKAQLKSRGFEIYTDPSPVVSARGPVRIAVPAATPSERSSSQNSTSRAAIPGGATAIRPA